MRHLMSRLISGFGRKSRARGTQPADPQILRARQLLQSGAPDQARQICRQLLTTEPQHAEAHNMLGGIALQRGEIEPAIAHFAKAVEFDPTQPAFRQGLGICYYNLGQYPQALDHLEKALVLDPKNPAAHNNLGNCYKQKGDLDDAVRCYRKAISASPMYLPAYINLADVLVKQKKYKAAVKTYRKALHYAADMPENLTDRVLLHHRLGLALRLLDQTDAAIASYKTAIAIQPDFAMAHNSLGGALLARNELDEAMACFRTALELEPGYSRVHSNILLTMNYLSGCTPEQIYAEALRYDAQHARDLLNRQEPFRNARDPSKVLRVGYLSPDFREHSVAHFTRQLMGRHNREAVEVYCYSDVETPDDVTGQFQAQADHWLSIVDAPDEAIAARIRQDGIDILVDLAGHTSNNRLPVFARKPAPVQVNWLGYPNTTGMRAMDYRLTDAIADPPGEADRLHTEKLIRLEHGFLCYQTEEPVPAGPAPPCVQHGQVTFGSFNMIKKMAPEVIRVWSQILQGGPGSRLILKSNALEDEGTRAGLLQAFAAQGIATDRIELINAVPSKKDHLALYAKIDIALDPFPYNGTTTTFEALWMGVPVICLRGDRHAGRVGASIMQHIGLPGLIADNEDEYVALAHELAGETRRLVTLHKTLRAKLRESVLMDVPLFTAALEHAYREMWKTWCNRRH